tara:strand:- start:1507 stop:2214 length:708 start_codon:yes stop_codon:yes gene_type:complete
MATINKKKLRAIILCGGEGSRLKPITNKIPKPLVKINSKPILGYLLEHLEQSSIDEYYIATGYKSNKIEEYFKINKTFKKKVTIINSGNVDIILRIKECIKHFNRKDDFMVFYGDTLSNIRVNNIIRFHKTHKGLASLAIWRLRSTFGLMNSDIKNKIVSYKEKPILDSWINIGYFYFSSNLIDVIKKYRKFEGFLSYLIKSNLMYGYKHKGLHYTVNTEEELNKLTRNIHRVAK